ncbi:band 4.1-like protein 4A [Pitangus sulphuratus]|nr:band 4.1-like protein 4A [Pitangus sulphuratus]
MGCFCAVPEEFYCEVLLLDESKLTLTTQQQGIKVLHFNSDILATIPLNCELPRSFPNLGIFEIVYLISIPVKTIGVLVCFGTNFKRRQTEPNFSANGN